MVKQNSLQPQKNIKILVMNLQGTRKFSGVSLSVSIAKGSVHDKVSII